MKRATDYESQAPRFDLQPWKILTSRELGRDIHAHPGRESECTWVEAPQGGTASLPIPPWYHYHDHRQHHDAELSATRARHLGVVVASFGAAASTTSQHHRRQQQHTTIHSFIHLIPRTTPNPFTVRTYLHLHPENTYQLARRQPLSQPASLHARARERYALARWLRHRCLDRIMLPSTGPCSQPSLRL